MTGITELRRGIASLGDIGPHVDIKVGSLDRFMKSIEDHCGGLVKADPKKIVNAQFCGVEVRENEYLPKNMAAVMQDGQIIQLIRFTDG